MDNIIDKFQGNINKLIEEDESVALSEMDKQEDENDVEFLQQRLAVLERKNEVLMGKSPNLAQLPLMLNLMNVMKNKGDQYILDNFTPVERMFLATSLQHSETSEGQALSLQMAELVHVGDKSGVVDVRAYCKSHAMVIEQFGRFPGRNNALGRESTKEEIEWLESPDCPEWAKSQLAPKT